MKLVRNEKSINRGKTIGKVLTFASLSVLGSVCTSPSKRKCQ